MDKIVFSPEVEIKLDQIPKDVYVKGQLPSLDYQSNWGVNHIDQFLRDLNSEIPFKITVFLNDNGESVFDIALFQKLLKDCDKLKVTFIVNRFPISNNISLSAFESLRADKYFEDLNGFFEKGFAEVIIENQVFRSFEYSHLQPETINKIKGSSALYVKGENFFETFQIPQKTRYYCFTVHSPTSVLLTGFPAGNGIFVKIIEGVNGYDYYSYNKVNTLKNKLSQVLEK